MMTIMMMTMMMIMVMMMIMMVMIIMIMLPTCSTGYDHHNYIDDFDFHDFD